MLRPRTLDEALAILGGTRARPIAGGTDLMVGLAAGTIDEAVPLLDLSAIAALRGIRMVDGRLVIGATTTFAELRASDIVAEHVPALAEVAATIGAAQIQARATLGGNLANASPAGDSLPVLLATEATIVVAGTGGERSIPVDAFFTGYRRTALDPGELIVRVEVPLPPGRRVRFRKVGTRRAQAISKVVLAVAWRPEPATGAWRDVRIGIGSVAEVPVRARHAEAALEGGTADAAAADRAAVAVGEDVRPIDDVRSTADYRRAVTGRILRRIVLDAAG